MVCKVEENKLEYAERGKDKELLALEEEKEKQRVRRQCKIKSSVCGGGGEQKKAISKRKLKKNNTAGI